MFIWPSIACYCAFSLFAYYNQRWSRDFRDESLLPSAVATMGFLAMLIGFAYLGYYAWKLSVIGAIAAFALSLLGTVIGVALERLLGTMTVQMASPVLWPVFAAAMFWTLGKL